MKALLVLAGIATLAYVCYGIVWAVNEIMEQRDERKTLQDNRVKNTGPRTDQEAYRIGRDMARHLERATEDPIASTTEQWRDRAQALANEWYDTRS